MSDLREAARALLDVIALKGISGSVGDCAQALRAALAADAERVSVPITRVEVVNHSKHASFQGRAYGWMNPLTEAEVSMQDDGRTLKVFITDAAAEKEPRDGS